MSTSTTEQPIKKSKYVKVIEGYESLSLSDKQEAFPLIQELLESDLEKEKEILQSKISQLTEFQESIKK